jgi:transcriptional regulator with XRE-family HTH domain
MATAAKLREGGLSFGERLRLLRKGRSMTMEDLAGRSGLRLNTIARLETGRSTNPTYDTLKKLAAALDVAVSDLVDNR